mgnify:FL=1
MNVRTINYKDSNNSHEFTRSLRQTGFGVLNNHPIDLNLIYDVYNEWEKFFNGKDKRKYLFDCVKQDGFFPLGTENAKGAAISDIKEFYHFYPWGRLPSDLSSNTKKLYKELVSLTSTLLHWIQDETPEHIKSLFSTPLPDMIIDSKTHLLRIIHYPPLDGKEEPEAIRGAAHEDINLITLLVAGTEPGLQVQDIHGSWHDVSCDPGSLAINSGDMLQEISGGYFPSTTHRVVNPSNNIKNKSRFSMPLFLHPRDDIILSKRYTARKYLDERLKEIGLKD